MAKELAFALINPYTIAKSRTGGVVARFLSRTDLDMVAVRMFAPSAELAQRYADWVRQSETEDPEMTGLIADYILNAYSPDKATGRPRRVMMLLFEGENAIEKIWKVCGSAKSRWASGETIRDTYGDFITDENGGVRYFEPAVLVGPTRRRAIATMRLWASYSQRDGGLVETACDTPEGAQAEKTLVLLKPDNFRFPSSRPGSVVDLLSRSGLRIVGAKKFRMTVRQAEEFYEQVKLRLRVKLRDQAANRAFNALSREFSFTIPEALRRTLGDDLGPCYADREFERIIEFMTGFRPSAVAEEEKSSAGRVDCLALVYKGVDAVSRIREILGATDPTQAAPGSVRREFGMDVLVNAAHASDTVENAVREIGIINVQEDTIKPWVDRYYGATDQQAG